MPKRTDIKSILIIGAGPIVIGQACEFDYSGTQACKALREEGYEVVLVNSNPATIMTDPEMADRTYIEPITPEFVERIIAVERPDAILPTLGGQTGLNVGLALHESGALARYGCQLIGASAEAIRKAEDRADVRQQDAARIAGGPYHLVFLDPPYRSGLGQQALDLVVDEGDVLAQDVKACEVATHPRGSQGGIGGRRKAVPPARRPEPRGRVAHSPVRARLQRSAARRASLEPDCAGQDRAAGGRL